MNCSCDCRVHARDDGEVLPVDVSVAQEQLLVVLPHDRTGPGLELVVLVDLAGVERPEDALRGCLSQFAGIRRWRGIWFTRFRVRGTWSAGWCGSLRTTLVQELHSLALLAPPLHGLVTVGFV